MRHWFAAAGCLVGVLLAADLALAELRTYEPADVTNFQLGPEYAQWLVGPIAHLASADERRQFLALTDDAEAAAFIDGFWERRGPNRGFPPTGPRITFEARAEEVDRRFTEGTSLGRRTDRGTVFILYGPPASIEFASPPRPEGEPIEVWSYPRPTEAGLDGEKPERRYAFRREGLVTRLVPVAILQSVGRGHSRGRERE